MALLFPGLVAGSIAAATAATIKTTLHNTDLMNNGLPLNSATNTKGMKTEAMIFCKTNIAGYFFDGFMSVDYTHDLEVTSNPVETGASVSDHSYVKPAEIQMLIRMSDVHQSLVKGQFSGGWSRSVTAWNILKKIQTDRIPVLVGTQLGMYYNMLIKSLQAQEDQSTYRGLYVTATLVELPVARVKTVKISSASQTTIETQMGQINAVKTNASEDASILYQMGFGAGAGTGSGFSSSASSGGAGEGIKLTCYCYNCNDNGAGGWGTTATASGRVATVGVTCAMSQRTLRKYGLKLGNQIAINGVGVRRIDDIAGVDNIIDIYVPATGSVRHCKCAQNPLSGKRTTFTKIS